MSEPPTAPDELPGSSASDAASGAVPPAARPGASTSLPAAARGASTWSAASAAMKRRPLLRWALGLGGVLAGAGAGGWLALFGVAPSAGPLRTLSDREHRTLRSLVPTILGAARRPLSATVAGAFDGFLADSPADVASDLKSALLWLELGPILYDGRAVIFSDLAQAEREAHLRAWMESDDVTRRIVATAFRKFVNLVAYDDPALWDEIHYPGPATGLRES